VAVGEQRLAGLNLAGPHKGSDLMDQLGLDRDGALFPSFAVQPDKASLHGVGLKAEDLGNARPGLIEEAEQQVVATADQRGGVDGAKHRHDLFAAHEADERLGGPFARDG